MTTSLKDITGIAFDFDGVFYPYHAIPDIHSEWAKANAQAMCTLLPSHITFDEAYKLAFTCFKEHGDPVTGQTEFAVQLGHDREAFRTEFFKLHNRFAFSFITGKAPHILTPDTRLKTAFESSNGHIKNGIASHGCVTEWVKPLLHAKALNTYIQENAVFGLQDGGFASKGKYPTLVELCFTALGTPLEEQAFVEDTPLNLAVMKEHNPQLTTIYIHHGNPIARLPSHIDCQFHDIPEMKAAMATARLTEQRIISLP